MRISITCALAVLPVACQSPKTEAPIEAPKQAAQSKPAPANTSKAVSTVMDAAVGKSVTLSCPPNSMYPAKGATSLVDGQMGAEFYEDPEWMGWWYEEKPFVATIDLGQPILIQSLGIHTLAATESWIFHPRKVEFEVSVDGKNFQNVATIRPTKDELENEEPNTKMIKAGDIGKTARYVRVKAERYGELPEWHAGYGGADGVEGEAWLFIDEILVNPK